MAVSEISHLLQVDAVPESVTDNNDDSSADAEAEPTTYRKTRRSRRGGYRRKKQHQKKVAALMAASNAKRATEAWTAAMMMEDNTSTTTATTSEEESSSSCESSAGGGGGVVSPTRVCARKKKTGTSQPAQRQMYQHFYQAYYQNAMQPVAPPQTYPVYSYGYPAAQRPVASPPRYNHHQKKGGKSNLVMTKERQDCYVALDCEMVGVGDYGAHSALARVTLVDWHGNVVMDEMVKPQWEVSDYRTFISGITKEMLDNATMDFATVRAQVLKHLEGKILVGHALKNDLCALGIDHPWHLIRDTAKYEPYMKVRFQDGCLWPRGLKDLCKEKLNRDVQVYGRPHCPKEDALAALDLYRLEWRQWEETMEYKLNGAWAMQQRR